MSSAGVFFQRDIFCGCAESSRQRRTDPKLIQSRVRMSQSRFSLHHDVLMTVLTSKVSRPRAWERDQRNRNSPKTDDARDERNGSDLEISTYVDV